MAVSGYNLIHCKCLKLTQKYFLDLRKFIFILKNGLKIRTIFLKQEIFSAKKSFLNIKKINLVLRYVLNSSQIFLQKGPENFS